MGNDDGVQMEIKTMCQCPCSIQCPLMPMTGGKDPRICRDWWVMTPRRRITVPTLLEQVCEVSSFKVILKHMQEFSRGVRLSVVLFWSHGFVPNWEKEQTRPKFPFPVSRAGRDPENVGQKLSCNIISSFGQLWEVGR